MIFYHATPSFATTYNLAGTCGNRTHPALLSQHHYGFEDRGSQAQTPYTVVDSRRLYATPVDKSVDKIA